MTRSVRRPVGNNADIIVGMKQPMGGRLDIDGNSKLRFQDLIIGSRETISVVTAAEMVGTDHRLGALYSNNPNSFRPDCRLISVLTRQSLGPLDVGFDLIVGEWGVMARSKFAAAAVPRFRTP